MKPATDCAAGFIDKRNKKINVLRVKLLFKNLSNSNGPFSPYFFFVGALRAEQ